MLDLFNFPSKWQADVQMFLGNSPTSGASWCQWTKPRGKTMAYVCCIGAGGNGGNGVIGANNLAAGGGGGGSAAQSTLICPVMLLPDVLFVSTPNSGVGSAAISYVSLMTDTIANHLLLMSRGGGNGGNASGATAGAGGAAGTITAIADCPRAGVGVYNFLVGQGGIAGGATGNGVALTLQATGLFVTGGTGGGGLGASGSTGGNGGAFTVPAAPSIFPPHPGGVGGATTTTPPQPGNPGYPFNGLLYGYGGTGGGATHGSATGAGLVQASGGNGAPGCGGGGSGGALTGSTAGQAGKGGSGLVVIICW
jgi:hypothetical protein